MEHIEEALGTSDFREAVAKEQIRKGQLLAEFDRVRRSGTARPVVPDGDDPEEVYRWRGDLRRAYEADDEGDSQFIVGDLLEERTRELSKIKGAGFGEQFFHLANTSVEKPTVLEGWDEWMQSAGYTQGTVEKYTHALNEFLRFMQVSDTVPDQVTPALARKFARWLDDVAESSRGTPLSFRSKRDRINALSSFWRNYLEYNEYSNPNTNPWQGIRIGGREKPSDQRNEPKRPYTNAEILTLLRGPEIRANATSAYPKTTLLEIYALGFYTGARLDEICSRRLGEIENIKGGYLMAISASKTEAGIRKIPILHPIPVGVIARRIGDRSGRAEQLFSELMPGGKDNKLSWQISKRLGLYRSNKCKLPSAVDFHSTRRNFISQLEALEADPLSIQRYVGHKPQGVTFGTYSQGSTGQAEKIARTIRYDDAIEREFLTQLRLD